MEYFWNNFPILELSGRLFVFLIHYLAFFVPMTVFRSMVYHNSEVILNFLDFIVHSFAIFWQNIGFFFTFYVR